MKDKRATRAQRPDVPKGYFRLDDATNQPCWPFPESYSFETLKAWKNNGKVVNYRGRRYRVFLKASRPGQFLITCEEWLLQFARELGDPPAEAAI